MTTIIIIVVLISAARLLWQINNEKHSGTADRNKQKKNTVRRHYQNSYSKDKRPQGKIEPFRKPTLQENLSNQEEEKEIIWNKKFLMSIEWKVFEDVCAEYFRLKNCNASVTNIGKDGGIDLKVKNEEGNVFVVGQCKAWKEPIGVKEIRELYGIMAAEKVKNGVYITTSTFTKDAQEFRKNKRILLIDGDEFIKRFNQLDEQSKAQLNKVARIEGYDIPTCVNCNVKMVKKQAIKDAI